jgi:hypothetical protein
VEEALAMINHSPWLTTQCEAILSKRGPFGGIRTCSAEPTMCVLRAAPSYPERLQNRYVLRCARHAELLRSDRQTIAVLALPKARLDAIRARYRREQAERRKQEGGAR